MISLNVSASQGSRLHSRDSVIRCQSVGRDAATRDPLLVQLGRHSAIRLFSRRAVDFCPKMRGTEDLNRLEDRLPDILEKVNKLKEDANEAFKGCRFQHAAQLYTEAIRVITTEALSCESESQAVALLSEGLYENEHAEPTDSATANGQVNGSSAAKSADESSPAETLRFLLVVLFANRAFTHLKVEAHGFAIKDAGLAIKLAKKPYPKAFYRRGAAYFALGKYKLALADFRKAAAAAPTDKDVRLKIRECERRLREEAFSAAIDSSRDTPASLCRNIDVSGIVVEDSYDGPRLVATHESNSGRIAAGDGSVTQRFCSDLLGHFRAQKRLHRKYLLQIIGAAYDLLRGYPNIVKLKLDSHDGSTDASATNAQQHRDSFTRPIPPAAADSNSFVTSSPVHVVPQLTVCGDTHGQFFDLVRIFELNGLPSAENPYLFNGDFVDRGSWSVEVVTTLLAFMVYDPRCMHLTRGNHESRNMNKIYGFEGEVRHKYSEHFFELFEELFQALPLGYLIEGANQKRALVVHGGLFSRNGVKLDDLLRLDRFVEPPSTGLFAELLWSDPQKEHGWGPSKRGVGVAFGPDVTKRFLDDNQLELLIRSHEMKDDGYEVEADGRLITIFSAPNYCDQMGNRGAFIRLKPDMKPEIVPFEAAEHPADVRPMMYASGGGGLFGLV
jgi:serine/threonine-protein phosphatase 5